MAHFGILSSFDHTIQNWKTFKNRLSQWFIANDISQKNDISGVKRRAILLSTLADATYQLTADLALPEQLEEVPYEVILELLDGHFTPKRCGFSERYNFYAAVQHPGESHTQWAARLRGLTAHCSFSDVEEALRDRFVMGMVAGPERDKLFAEDIKTLTLSKAVELAENMRCARSGAAAAASLSLRDDSVLNVQSHRYSAGASKSQVKEKCAVCGRNNHKSSQCRFANFVCRKCNTKGHLRKMCKVNCVGSVETNEGDDDDGKVVLNISSKHGEPMTEIVLANGIQLKFEIDSGSAVTIISEQLYKRYFSNSPLSSPKKKLFTYTGSSIQCIGQIPLLMSYKHMTHTIDAYVVRDGGTPLLGRDFISQFGLQLLVPCYSINNNLNELVVRLQHRFSKVFSDELGEFKKYRVKLQLKDDAKPIFFRARPIAFALRGKVDEEINRLLSLGVLKQVEYSDYASPIVPVLKRNGSVRLCADYSVSINKQLVVEKYPLPTIHELFSKLHGGQQFSKLDLSMAYNQLVLDEDSQNITCINTHRGLFKYTRMVFGLTSAPSIFQRVMENILSGLDGVLCLLDDVLVTANEPGLHYQRLTAVLQRLQDAGLTLQKEKCDFFKDEISYLGYIINKEGLKKSPDKIKAIREAPPPANINQLQSFLGLVNYYRNFVQGASDILSPLYNLLKKGAKWAWTDVHQSAFLEIKNRLVSDQVLAHFNPEAKIILTVDASPNGLGAILSQIDKDGYERPISFASRTLTAAETRYSQIQKEATAIIFGVRKYHQYLYGKSDPFILRTDHKPLISIFGPHKGIPEITANRLQRYAIFLSAYNYKIEYIRSENNCADYLSRASLTDTSGGSSAANVQHCKAPSATANDSVDRASYVQFVVDGTMPVTLDTLRAETDKDVILNKVIYFISKGWPKKCSDINLKPFHACRTQLSYENGCIMRGHKVVLPESLRFQILSELHSSHLGIVKTKAEARSRVWFPGIDGALEKMINSCQVCIQLRQSPPRAPLAPWRFPPQPFFRIHIDFLGPLENRLYLIVVDAYTKWVEIYDMTGNTSSSAVIEKIQEFISRFGLPNTIVSDNGTAFTSYEFKHFCELNRITLVTSPPYHPASNGQAESFVKIIKKGIKSCVLSSITHKECKAKLLKYLFDYRNSIHSVTGFSPAQLVFGRKLRARLDLLLQPSSPALVSLDNTVKSKQFSQCKSYGGINKQSFVKDNEILYKKYINNSKFVWCRGTIVKRLGKVVYLINDHLSGTLVKKHKNQIVHYTGYDKNTHSMWNAAAVIPPATSSTSTSSEANVAGVQPEHRSDTASQQSVTSRLPTRLLRNIPRVDYKPYL